MGGIYYSWEVTHMGPSGTKLNMEQSQVKKIHIPNDFFVAILEKHNVGFIIARGGD